MRYFTGTHIALGGLVIITAHKLGFTGFKEGAGLAGLGLHLSHEFSLLANLFLLLMGFALLARHFEESAIPDEMPVLLPGGWRGGVVLLAIVFVLSSFLDNIAAAIIGGTVARHVFRGKVHIGYLAAIVAASNAGGAGSVVGDTTTTMMWVSGVSPLSVLEAYVAAVVALLIFAVPASLQQQRHSPIVTHAPRGLTIDWARVFIGAAMLVVALIVNIVTNLYFPELLGRVPVLGLSVDSTVCSHSFEATRLESAAGGFQGDDFSACPRDRSLNDARGEVTRSFMADDIGARVRFGGVRQHTFDRSCP